MFASPLREVMVKSQCELVSTALLSGEGKGREILPSLSKTFLSLSNYFSCCRECNSVMKQSIKKPSRQLTTVCS